MTALAAELGVNRVTLDRWVGYLDVLLGEEPEAALRVLLPRTR